MFGSHDVSLAPIAYRINHWHGHYAMTALKEHMICLTSKRSSHELRVGCAPAMLLPIEYAIAILSLSGLPCETKIITWFI